MITLMHIKNIGIIEDIAIDLNTGFNVLTGETGSGKSLIIDALKIISGGRFSKEVMRKGEDHSFIEICIYDENNEDDSNIIVSREIYLNGRNFCKINGRLVTVQELKKFMKNFLEIHGQYDNQALFEVSEHMKLVDLFIGKDLNEVKEKYKELFLEYNNIKNKLSEFYEDEMQKERKIDLLNYQLNEILEANIKLGEDEELEKEKKIISNYEKIFENINIAKSNISLSVLDNLNIVIKSLNKIQYLDEKYANKVNSIENIYYDLQEVDNDLNFYIEELDFDEFKFKQIDERLDLINSLKRKYGNSLEQILIYQKELEGKIEKIENLEEYNKKLKDRLNIVEEELYILAEEISKIRQKNSKILEEKINFEISDLDMKNTKIKIELDKLKTFNQNGLDKIELLVITNKGDDYKALNKIASGGEMSRIMLAIKTVIFNNCDSLPMMVFDEIDSGISGLAAKKVSEKLKKISKKNQILTITHLPIITASADYNYKVKKEVEGEKTKTFVELLKDDDIIKEIAWISSGEITEAALKHAIELKKCQI